MAWRPYRKDCTHGLAHLSTNIKLTLYKALIMSVMAYTCARWKYATDVHLLKLQTPGEESSMRYWKPRQTHSGSELHLAFKIPYMYNYIIKLCRTQAEVIINHQNPIVHGVWARRSHA
jgi:hypothetical protein